MGLPAIDKVCSPVCGIAYSRIVVPMAEETQVTLRYLGPDVDDGSIGVDDLLSALNGFSSAFYKVAERVDLDQQSRIKVSGITQSSANIHLTIIEIAKAHEGLILTATSGIAVSALAGSREAVKDAAKRFTSKVIDRIAGTAKAKKHTQGGDYNVGEIAGDNNRVLIVNNLNVSLPVDKSVLDLLREGTIDSELDKMTAPLREEAIDSFELRQDGEAMPDLRLEASDRPYFAKPRQTRTTTTQETELVGTLNTISKSTNAGVFISDSGKRIRYRLLGEDISELYRRFAHIGLVKVRCTAKLDQNLDVVSIDISDIRPYDPNAPG